LLHWWWPQVPPITCGFLLTRYPLYGEHLYHTVPQSEEVPFKIHCLPSSCLCFKSPKELNLNFSTQILYSCLISH
jgi:hypothetical protein